MDDFNRVDADAEDLVDSAFGCLADFFKVMRPPPSCPKLRIPGGHMSSRAFRRPSQTTTDSKAPEEDHLPNPGQGTLRRRDRPQVGGQTQLRQPDGLWEGRTGGVVAHLWQGECQRGRPKRNDARHAGCFAATRGILEQVPPRFIPFTAPRAATGVLYADASSLRARTPQGRLGTQCPDDALPEGGQWLGLRRQDWLPVRYDSRASSTPNGRIFTLEVLAQILAVVTLADYLGEDWVAFINKRYGRDAAVNGLLFAFWSLAATRSWRPTFYRVTSEANIADPISQADCTLAVRHGWSQADTNLTNILEILAWAADEMEYAGHRAASDLQAL